MADGRWGPVSVRHKTGTQPGEKLPAVRDRLKTTSNSRGDIPETHRAAAKPTRKLEKGMKAPYRLRCDAGSVDPANLPTQARSWLHRRRRALMAVSAPI